MDIPLQFKPFFDALQKVEFHEGNGGYWFARCPSHDDNNPSLSIRLGNKGLLVKCLSDKCSAKDICAAVGWKVKQLFYDDFKREDIKWEQVATYSYQDHDGVERYQTVRLHGIMEGMQITKRFVQRRRDAFTNKWINNLNGVTLLPYRLPQLIANPKQPIVIVEGEKCVHAVESLGLIATCSAGGKWGRDITAYLAGRRCAVVPDNDDVGFRKAVELCGLLVDTEADEIRLVQNLPYKRPKEDIADILAHAKGNKRSQRKRLSELIRQNPRYIRASGDFENSHKE